MWAQRKRGSNLHIPLFPSAHFSSLCHQCPPVRKLALPNMKNKSLRWVQMENMDQQQKLSPWWLHIWEQPPSRKPFSTLPWPLCRASPPGRQQDLFYIESLFGQVFSPFFLKPKRSWLPWAAGENCAEIRKNPGKKNRKQNGTKCQELNRCLFWSMSSFSKPKKE